MDAAAFVNFTPGLKEAFVSSCYNQIRGQLVYQQDLFCHPISFDDALTAHFEALCF